MPAAFRSSNKDRGGSPVVNELKVGRSNFDGSRCQFKIVDIASFMAEFPSIGQKNAPDSVEFVSNA